jgi:hypothetical protein
MCSACATGKAASAPELPALDVPSPPPRVLPPLEGGPIEGVVHSGVEAPTDTRPQPRHREGPRGDTGRPEVKPEAPRTDVPPAEAPPPETAPAAEARGAVPPALDGETVRVAQSVRLLLDRANKDLSQVDYGALPIDAKSQYDAAKRFMALANQAIRDQNLIFAQTLADKAAAIAALLSRR